jgi:cyclopropane-fatty-acyl-phospholipid synthase
VSDIEDVVALLGSYKPPAIGAAERARLAAAAIRAIGVTRPPRRPEAELVPRGRRHSRTRDARAVRHHYDVSNEFFELLLGPSLTYSCALFSRGARTLEEAQAAKHELVCTKLGTARRRGTCSTWAAGGARSRFTPPSTTGFGCSGSPLSAPQAELARKRALDAGLQDRVRFQVADYRDLGAEQFDAISSIGMVEHVGAVQIDAYAAHLARILKPGGRLLNHGIARLRHSDPESGSFSERFVFPDAAPLHLSRVQWALERAGLETDQVEGPAVRLRRDPQPLGGEP